MRLLNTRDFTLAYFNDERTVPKYAILSHTWGEEEVTLESYPFGDATSKMKGLEKLRRFCWVAAQQGFEWVWMDTCCINKSSSAELSEAINSDNVIGTFSARVLRVQ